MPYHQTTQRVILLTKSKRSTITKYEHNTPLTYNQRKITSLEMSKMRSDKYFVIIRQRMCGTSSINQTWRQKKRKNSEEDRCCRRMPFRVGTDTDPLTSGFVAQPLHMCKLCILPLLGKGKHVRWGTPSTFWVLCCFDQLRAILTLLFFLFFFFFFVFFPRLFLGVFFSRRCRLFKLLVSFCLMLTYWLSLLFRTIITIIWDSRRLTKLKTFYYCQ